MTNKNFQYSLAALSVFVFVWACTTKEISLVSNIDYDVVTEYTESGFVQDSLTTQVVLIPEVRDYPGFEYHLQYELVVGNGYFIDEQQERISDLTAILLEPAQDYTANWTYIGTEPGEHLIKLHTNDNFGKKQSYDLNYTIRPDEVIWAASSTRTQGKVNDTIPINLQISRETPTSSAIDFSYAIIIKEGSGIALTETGEALATNTPISIVEGQTKILFIPDSAGALGLDFVLSYYDTEQKTASLNLTVVGEDVNLSPIAVAQIENDGVNKGEGPFTVSFDGSDSMDDGTINNYQWDFGDGSPVINGQIVNHTFATIGEYLVTLQVTDDLGAINTNTDTNTVRVFVEETMQSDFMAVDDVLTVENTPTVVLDVLDNDQIPDGTTAMITAVTQPNNGSTAIQPDGTIAYNPTATFTGKESFSYTITNDEGITSSAAVSLTVTITDQPPIAKDDVATTNENEPVTIAVLDNDEDPEDKTLTITENSVPTNGTITINPNGTISYTPTTGFSGEDQFTYTINDGITGNDATATVTITVIEVNQPPVAMNFDVTATDIEVKKSINIVDTVKDPENDPITITSVTAINGSVTANADGTISYTPLFGRASTDQITVTVNDGTAGNDATATIAVEVTRADTIPVPRGDMEQFLINGGYDTTGVEDGQMLRADAEAIENIEFEVGGNFNLLRYFSNLNRLRFKGKDVEKIVLVNMNYLSKLETFISLDSPIDSLDFSGARNLKSVVLENTSVKYMDLSLNSELESFSDNLGGLQLLHELNFSFNKKLQSITLFLSSFTRVLFDNPNVKKLNIVVNTQIDQNFYDLTSMIALESVDVKFPLRPYKFNNVTIDLKNGNNLNIIDLDVRGVSVNVDDEEVPICIAVDDLTFSETKELSGEWKTSAKTTFSLDCTN